MASITTSGIGSGLDVAAIVAQLVTAERAPAQTRLDTREAEALSKLSALGTVKSALASFQTALEPLKTLETFQGRTATSANEDIFTASAGASAAPGRYAIEITTLASGHKIRSDAFASDDTVVGSGTLTISSDSEVFTVDIASPNDTLAEIADAINSSEFNTKVLATIVNSVDGAHLVLSSSETGASSAITVQVAGDPGLDTLIYDPIGGTTNMTEVTAAADADLLIDGLQVTSSSNVIEDAVEGVIVDLVSANPGTTYDLTVNYDTDGAREKLREFVDAYNNLLTTLASQTSFDVETLQASALFGESSVRNLVSDIRSTTGGIISGTASSFSSLIEIGISTNLDGTLSIDEAAVSDAFAQDFDDVGRLLSDEVGFASTLDDLVSSFLAPTAALETRTDGLELLIDDITDQREALDRRMFALQTRLNAQFSALDTLISQLDSTSAFLGQQLANLPGFTTNTNE